VDDIKAIRLRNLKAELARKEPRERARYLKDKLGNTVGFWSGVLAGDRTFGEKLARRIEAGLHLAHGRLDWEAEVIDVEALTPRYSKAGLELLERFEALPVSEAKERVYRLLLSQIAAVALGADPTRSAPRLGVEPKQDQPADQTPLRDKAPKRP
jgi:hypothetical protein